MHLKWLEDVLAVSKAPSLTEAARARRVTQPAFSRRLRALEDWLGTDLVDRSHKSGSLTTAAQVHLGQIETLVEQFHRLQKDLLHWKGANGRLMLVAQHSLATTMLPRLVVCLRDNDAIAEVGVRAADLDDCRTMLANGDADILVAYEALGGPTSTEDGLDRLFLASDDLIAVASPRVAAKVREALARAAAVDLVTYPRNVFFGSLLHANILPTLGARLDLRIRCETALASGVMELVLAEVGVGWLPRLLAEEKLVGGALINLTDQLGGIPLRISAHRSLQNASPQANEAWDIIRSN